MEPVIAVVLALVALAVIAALAAARGRAPSPDALRGLVAAEFTAFREELTRTLDANRQELSRAREATGQQALDTLRHLREMDATVRELLKHQEEAERLGADLATLLAQPKLRGSYGETVLEELLARALPAGLWKRQYEIADGQRVDAVVLLKDLVIPIDAKFPRDDYERYAAAPDNEGKRAAWKAYETALKRQIESIRAKYVKPEMGTSEYALLFIPSEAVYYETIAEKTAIGDTNALWDYARERQVVPVSPNTFYAYLQVIVHAARNIEIVKEARSLQEGLRKVEKNLAEYMARHEDVGRHLDKAQEAWRTGSTHLAHLRGNVEKTTRLEFRTEAAPDRQE